jgi:hypothetical protein
MKKGYWMAAALALGFVGLGVTAFQKTLTPYVSFEEAWHARRAVDESGNQLAVFGRRGSRPLDQSEMFKMYLRGDKIWTVSNDPPSAPQAFRLPDAPGAQSAAKK